MDTIQSFSDTTGISRLLSSFYHVKEDTYYRDSEHGDKTHALAALLLDRFEAQIQQAELEGDPPRKGYVNTHTKNETGIVGISRVNYRKEGNRYYSVSVSKLKATDYFNIPVKKYGEDLAYGMALRVRHFYAHYIYGERYHEVRRQKDTALPPDSHLEDYGIPPVPDFAPYSFPEEKQPEMDFSEPSSSSKNQLTIIKKTGDNRYYEKYPDFPRVQGVCYVESIHGFSATFPGDGGSQTFTVKAHGAEKAYVQAVNVRHQFCKDYYGEKYHKARNNDDNLLPSNKTLNKLGITP